MDLIYATLTESAPSLPPLRQAEEAPATSTEEMANTSAPSPSIVDGRFTPSTFS
jgi:hypothetical protein